MAPGCLQILCATTKRKRRRTLGSCNDPTRSTPPCIMLHRIRLSRHSSRPNDEVGHRLVVRNGRCPERSILTRVRPLPVRPPPCATIVLPNRARPSDLDTCPRTCAGRVPLLSSRHELVPSLVLAGVSANDIADSLRPSPMQVLVTAGCESPTDLETGA